MTWHYIFTKSPARSNNINDLRPTEGLSLLKISLNLESYVRCAAREYRRTRGVVLRLREHEVFPARRVLEGGFTLRARGRARRTLPQGRPQANGAASRCRRRRRGCLLSESEFFRLRRVDSERLAEGQQRLLEAFARIEQPCVAHRAADPSRPAD